MKNEKAKLDPEKISGLDPELLKHPDLQKIINIQQLLLEEEIKNSITSWAKRRLSALVVVISIMIVFGVTTLISTLFRSEVEKATALFRAEVDKARNVLALVRARLEIAEPKIRIAEEIAGNVDGRIASKLKEATAELERAMTEKGSALLKATYRRVDEDVETMSKSISELRLAVETLGHVVQNDRVLAEINKISVIQGERVKERARFDMFSKYEFNTCVPNTEKEFIEEVKKRLVELGFRFSSSTVLDGNCRDVGPTVFIQYPYHMEPEVLLEMQTVVALVFPDYKIKSSKTYSYDFFWIGVAA